MALSTYYIIWMLPMLIMRSDITMHAMAEFISPKKRSKKRSNQIKRNEKGGILIEKKDLKKLFEFLDVSNKKYLTETDLRNRLSIFYKSGGPSSKEYKALMNNR
eukprot:652188_1